MTLRERLLEMSESGYRKFTSALMPGVENVLGIRIPVLRRLAREIVRGDWRAYLAGAEDFYFEERMLQGLVIASAPCRVEERLSYTERFVPKIDNWGRVRLFLLAVASRRTRADVAFHTVLFPFRKGVRRALCRGDGTGKFRG